MPIRALIFDVDGTLAETEELHRLAFNESFAASGLSWNWDKALYARLLEVTGGKERIRHYLSLPECSDRLDDDEVAQLHAAKTIRYTRMVDSGGLALRPGVQRLLEEACIAGLRIAIATTTSRANVDALLRVTMPGCAFDAIAAGDEVAAKKPAPDIYRLAIARLGLQAEDCVAFEDTANGLRSATAAGLACVVTVSLYGGFGPFPGALAVVDQLGEANLPATVLSGAPLGTPFVDRAALDLWLLGGNARQA